MDKYLKELSLQFEDWLISVGFSDFLADKIADYIWLISSLILSVLIYYLVRDIVYRIVKRIASRSKSQFDDFLLRRKFFQRLCYLVPAFLFKGLLPIVVSDMTGLIACLDTLVSIYIVFVFLITIDACLNAVHDLYLTTPIAKNKPIKGFVQILKIIIYFIGAVVVIGILLNRNPLAILGGLGAISAILMLIFRDSILGFVAGIQLSANNMIMIGDWITIPKHEADGNVIEITLTTVKIENFDKTISFVPAYTLVSDSFRNWRGMEEAGVRRIARSLQIDMGSVKFCTPEMLERFAQFKLIKNYVLQKEEELLQYNRQFGFDDTVIVNGRRQTNLGIFRAYVLEYLKNNTNVHQGMTMMVRQLAPNEKGIPLQVYCFVKTTQWETYEKIQADIFDHLIAVLPYFELKLFQIPTGGDFRALVTQS
ncbi:MAG: mechanosensitive ion channel [Lentimicrobium sp.]